MKYRRSLRFRIVFTFSIFSAILAAIYGFLLHLGIFIGEDVVFNNLLQSEIENFLTEYKLNKTATLPNSAYVKSYLGTDLMPGDFKHSLKELGEGIYETDSPQGIDGPEGYHIAVKKIPGSPMLLYVLYDVNRFKMDERLVALSTLIILTCFIFVTLIGGWLGFLLSRRIIAPVTLLADKIRHLDPGKNDLDLSGQFSDDEIGFLARALEQSMIRTRAMIEREKQFTRDASHELRTPLTIMKGALELIQDCPGYHEMPIEKPVKRIERSVEDMRLTIESLLWLAREDAVMETHPPCNAFSVVHGSLEQIRLVFKNKSIETQLITKANPTLCVPQPVLQMIITNLLHNAFHFTLKGKITVTIEKDHIRVTDTGSGIDPATLDTVTQPHVRGKDSQGFGLGLSIVQRLSERFGLKLIIESAPNEGTNVQLWFPHTFHSEKAHVTTINNQQHRAQLFEFL